MIGVSVTSPWAICQLRAASGACDNLFSALRKPHSAVFGVFPLTKATENVEIFNFRRRVD